MKALSAPKSLHNLSLPTVVIKLLVASCNHIFHGFHSLEYQHMAYDFAFCACALSSTVLKVKRGF